MISIQDYATQKGVSYEAVRKQIDRYKEDLDGHIITQGRKRFLDDEAVSFLDEKRNSNPIVIMEQSKDDEIRQLQAENKELLLKLCMAQERLLHDADRIAELTAEVHELKLLQSAKQEEPKTEAIPKPKLTLWERIRNGWRRDAHDEICEGNDN